MPTSRGLHAAFRVGVLFKGIDGALEVVGAAIPLFVRPDQLVEAVRVLTRHELSRNPHSFLATHLVQAAGRLSAGGELFASIYLLLHGVLKLWLVWALLRSRLWAYPVAIAMFALFGVYQMIRWADSHSPLMLALTVLDVFVILLTWAEYRRLRQDAAAPVHA